MAMMYLTTRLSKFDITDWQGKPSGYRGKWFEFLVEDAYSFRSAGRSVIIIILIIIRLSINEKSAGMRNQLE